MKYFACQNSVVLGVFDSIEEARECIEKEKQKDLLSLMLKKKLLKKLQKNGSDISIHSYYIIKSVEVLK